MPDFDDTARFDSPSVGGQNVEFEDEGVMSQVSGAIEPLKKFLPLIIAVAVVAAIGWLAYDYFIGSVLPATITVHDTEGNTLANSNVKVFATGSSAPLFEGSGNSVYDVSLKTGTYRYEATASGYAIKRSSFDVSADNPEAVIVLEKAYDVEILSLEQTFPGKLYVGGSRQFTVQLKNNSGSAQTVDLVAGSGIEDFALSGNQGISLSAGQTKEVPLEISVPNETEVDDEKKGDGMTAVIRVKYTNEKDNADFTLYTNPSVEMKLSEADFRAKARQNQNKDQDTIEVDNDNYFPVEGMVLTIEITSATLNNPNEVETWFSFTEIANSANPRELEISSIPGRGDVEKELQVIVPLNAKKELGIKGNVVLDAPFLSEPIKRVLTLDVTDAAEHSVDLSLSPRSPVEISWDSVTGLYTKREVRLTVENSGQLDLQNIVVSVANSFECDSSWLDFKAGENNNISSLRVGEEKTMVLEAKAPVAARTSRRTMSCDIRYIYNNPVGSGFVDDRLNSFIVIEPEFE